MTSQLDEVHAEKKERRHTVTTCPEVMIRAATPTKTKLESDKTELEKPSNNNYIQIGATKKRRSSRSEHAKSARHRKKSVTSNNSLRAHSVAVINEVDGKNKWKEHARNNVEKILANLERESKDKWSDYVRKELSKHSDDLVKKMEKKIEPTIPEKAKNKKKQKQQIETDDEEDTIAKIDSAAVNLNTPTKRMNQNHAQAKNQSKTGHPKLDNTNRHVENRTQGKTNDDVNPQNNSKNNNGDMVMADDKMADHTESVDAANIDDDVNFILTVDKQYKKEKTTNVRNTKADLNLNSNEEPVNQKQLSEEERFLELEESILNSHEHSKGNLKRDGSQEVDNLIKDLQLEV